MYRKKQTSHNPVCESACRRHVLHQKSCKLLSESCRIPHHQPSSLPELVGQHMDAAGKMHIDACGLSFPCSRLPLPPAHVCLLMQVLSPALSSTTSDFLNLICTRVLLPPCRPQPPSSRPNETYHKNPSSGWRTRQCIAPPLRTRSYCPLFGARDRQGE